MFDFYFFNSQRFLKNRLGSFQKISQKYLKNILEILSIGLLDIKLHIQQQPRIKCSKHSLHNLVKSKVKGKPLCIILHYAKQKKYDSMEDYYNQFLLGYLQQFHNNIMIFISRKHFEKVYEPR
jgi:hypothetical protein